MDATWLTSSPRATAPAHSDEARRRHALVCLLGNSTGFWDQQGALEASGLEIVHLRSRVEQLESELREARAEARRLQSQLRQETIEPPEELEPLGEQTGIIGRSAALRRILSQARQVAPTHSAVLVLGETGTGKELLASAIHQFSPRGRRAMVRVNCAAIPATLMESEFFGRERGAYTGAFTRQSGCFELASGSTLFLDEVGELSVEMQAKLLRVLQEMKLQRLGSPATIKVDVRVIAASNRDLAWLTREGKFRQDLYYRLSVFPIRVPPLRERREDIPLLAAAFIAEFARALGKEVRSIARSDVRALESYPWPGNIRELRNVLERAVILARGPHLRLELPALG